MGSFWYPTDDTYIHLAMARDIAVYGTWGVNPGEFAPATSSPLWTLLLAAGFKLVGVRLWLPIALALACAIGLLSTLDAFGRMEKWTPFFRAAVLIAVVIVMPLIPLCVLGMEHVLQTWLAVIAIYLIWRLPARGFPLSGKYIFALLAVSFFSTSVRYEGMFQGLAIMILLCWDRRWKLAFCVGVAAFLPVAVMGAASVAHGWSFMPSSVRLKGNFGNQSGLLKSMISMVARAVTNVQNIKPHFAATVVAPLFVLSILPARFLDNRAARVCALFLMVYLQHLAFASIGWFFRYEAYLIVAQVLVIALVSASTLMSGTVRWPVILITIPGVAGLVLIVALAGLELSRGAIAIARTPVAMKNIHDEQGEMAAFAKRFYRGSTIAANDIGALCFQNSVHVIDLVGLGDRTIFQARMHANYTTRMIENYCADQNVAIAMVYTSWFAGEYAVPNTWKRVGSLRIENNQVCAVDTVDFYAVAPGSEPKLERSLREFASQVPGDVHIALVDQPAVKAVAFR